jgi:PKD repeat protein
MKKLSLLLTLVFIWTCSSGGGGSPTEPKETAPVANFTANPTNLTQGRAVTFTSTSTGTITSYSWNVDADPTPEATTASFTHSYEDVGTYGVTLTVTGPGGSNTKSSPNLITVSSAAPTPTTATSQSVQEDGSTTISLTATDPNGQAVTFAITMEPSNGTASLSGSTLTYTPDANFYGTDTVAYTASNGTYTSDPVTITITVEGEDDGDPTTNDISATTDEDTPVTLTLDATEIDGDSYSFAIITQPSNGTLGTISNNQVTYTPNENWNGEDTFTFEATDDKTFNRRNIATATITVNAVNDAPVANDVTASMNENKIAGLYQPVTITLDVTDVEGDDLTYSIVGTPSNGTLGSISDNQIIYTPSQDYNGEDTFTYKANDGTADSNTATVTVTINAVNDAPVTENQTASTDEDTAVEITLTATDVENDNLTFTIVSDVSNGTTSLSGATVTYTPTANFNGTDTFTFKANDGTDDSNTSTVTITVTSVEDSPTTNDITASTDEDAAVDITLDGSDGDGDSLTYSVVNTNNGSVTISGAIAVYTPNANYNGTDTFTYKANDGDEESNTSTITVTVNAVNDAPTIQDMEEIEGVEDTDLTITPSGEDIDGDNLSFYVVDQPTQGTMTENGATLIYTPNADFYGADSLTYKAYDGTTYSEAKKIPLFIDRGPRDWPFIYHDPGRNGSMNNRPHNWEGKMFDYDGNGRADMIGFSYYVQVAEEPDNYGNLNGYITIDTIDAISSIPDEIIGSDDSYWNGGTAEFGHINNDGIVDMFLSFQREYCSPWPDCEHDTGPSVIGISNNGDYDWQLVSENLKFWQDGNIEFTDIDSDGDIDIIAQDNEAYKVSRDYLIIYKNDGSNTFTEERVSLSQQVSLEEFRVKDLDKDGYKDIIGFGGGGTGSLHILYGTSQWDVFDYEELNFADESDSFQDLTIVDLENDGYYEILTHRFISSRVPDNTFQTYLFRSNASRGYYIDTNTQYSLEFNSVAGPILKTQAWDFDGDGDDDIFINLFNEWNPDVKYVDAGGGCCYCWHRDLDSEANGTLNRGYFWKNNDGVLEKTFFNIKEDECTFDSFYGFEGIFD